MIMDGVIDIDGETLGHATSKLIEIVLRDTEIVHWTLHLKSSRHDKLKPCLTNLCLEI